MAETTQKMWYEESGELSDIVCSSGVILARNLSSYPFPHKLSAADAQKCSNEIIECLEQDENTHTAFSVIDMQQTNKQARGFLYEQDLITEKFAEIRREAGQTLLLSEDHGTSVMLQEEDHICLKVQKTGLSLEKCYAELSHYDELFCRRLPIAFDSTYGYLTASPYHLGTGLQVYVLLHLPMLERSGAVERFQMTAEKLGIQITALSEDAWKEASVYRVTNSITLGIREDAVVSNLESVARQLAALEQQARHQLLDGNDKYKDRLMRSAGILKYAVLLDCAESYRLLSDVRLAASMKYIRLPAPQLITQIYYEAGEAFTASQCSSKQDQNERCRTRARIIQESLRMI